MFHQVSWGSGCPGAILMGTQQPHCYSRVTLVLHARQNPVKGGISSSYLAYEARGLLLRYKVSFILRSVLQIFFGEFLGKIHCN